MGLFNKKEKKLRKEFAKKNASFCWESVKEMEELYDELKASYEELDIMEEFRQFKEEAAQHLSAEDNEKLEYFLKKFRNIDKCARDAVRDVRDLLRNQRKKLKEALQDEKRI